MSKEIRKVLLDFDGNLTDEARQAAELAGIAIDLLADILGVRSGDIEALYLEIKSRILADPHLYPWEINGLPACYAVEGAYLLNTVILQQILKTEPRFLSTVAGKYPPAALDPISQCVNHLFHEGTLSVNPYFLPQTRDFLGALLTNPAVEAVIMTNSETRKIAANLVKLEIGVVGSGHPYPDEIAVLGDARQYHLDRNWPQKFDHPTEGPIQILPITQQFAVDLRRPSYFTVLRQEMAKNYADIVIVADGFSLAGALPLMMGLSFILHRISDTPAWAENFVAAHPRGRVASGLTQIEQFISSG